VCQSNTIDEVVYDRQRADSGRGEVEVIVRIGHGPFPEA
jgi:hypothetical protein